MSKLGVQLAGVAREQGLIDVNTLVGGVRHLIMGHATALAEPTRDERG
ncbi:MAG: hypothetical protein O7B81_11465 [Gammaproteobacteria bacterium]|nr:hypothetical protein [Gammaproteobacteria bacterium]